jgi:hypothetical protein
MSFTAISPSIGYGEIQYYSSHRGAGISIIAGADIHIFVFTDCKNNRFQKKLIGQNTNI